jgi:hypothetical protein
VMHQENGQIQVAMNNDTCEFPIVIMAVLY